MSPSKQSLPSPSSGQETGCALVSGVIPSLGGDGFFSVQVKNPAFQFYPNDWLSSPKIALMSPAEEGAYIRLLCYDWACDGLPDDDAKLAQLSRLVEGYFKGSSTVLRQCFVPHPTKDGYITNPRLLQERKKQAEWRRKCSQGGKNSALTRNEGYLKGSSRVVQVKGNSSSSSSPSSSSSSHFLPTSESAGEARAREVQQNEGEPCYKTPPSVEIRPTPTESEVIAQCGMIGIPEDCGRAYWLSRDKVSWLSRGQRITNWVSDLRGFHLAWVERERREPKRHGPVRHTTEDYEKGF